MLQFRLNKKYISLARPQHYIKNGFIFVPLFFGHEISHITKLLLTCLSFICFCFAASSIYAINDIMDAPEDRQHPLKKNRPVASGIISIKFALAFAIILLVSSLLISLLTLPRNHTYLLSGYLIINLAYSFKLKHVPIVDIFIISLGFIIRIFAGSITSGIPLTHWIVLITFLLALFLGLAKRKDDFLLSQNGAKVRKNIDGYSLDFILSSTSFIAAITIACYILFTVDSTRIAYHDSKYLYITTIWVICGFLRYFQLTFVYHTTGSPVRIVLTDSFLQIVLALYIITVAVIIYHNKIIVAFKSALFLINNLYLQ
jgi:4-hydroxybenzoate polyprenyltransferase